MRRTDPSRSPAPAAAASARPFASATASLSASRSAAARFFRFEPDVADAGRAGRDGGVHQLAEPVQIVHAHFDAVGDDVASGDALAVDPVDVLAEVDAERADRVGGYASRLHRLLHAGHRLRVFLLCLLGLRRARLGGQLKKRAVRRAFNRRRAVDDDHGWTGWRWRLRSRGAGSKKRDGKGRDQLIHGALFRNSGEWPVSHKRLESPVPSSASHPAGPLAGVTVLDLTRVLSGPYCTMLLADMGARVIKIEHPGRGDDTRAWGPPFINGESSYFLSINRNKESVALDFKRPEGRRALDALIARADVVVENFRPACLRAWGSTTARWQPRTRG